MLLHVDTITRTAEFDELAANMKLRPWQWAFLLAADGRTKLGELARSCGLEFDSATDLIHEAEALGLVQIVTLSLEAYLAAPEASRAPAVKTNGATSGAAFADGTTATGTPETLTVLEAPSTSRKPLSVSFDSLTSLMADWDTVPAMADEAEDQQPFSAAEGEAFSEPFADRYGAYDSSAPRENGEHFGTHGSAPVEQLTHDPVAAIDPPAPKGVSFSLSAATFQLASPVTEALDHVDDVEHTDHADHGGHAENAEDVEHIDYAARADHLEPVAHDEHANSAELLGNVEHAGRVIHMNYGEHASYAEHANRDELEDNAEDADSAEHAEHHAQVDHVDLNYDEHLTSADHAGHATHAERAEHANSTNYADAAERADAGNANHTEYADRAVNADKPDYADRAEHADHADGVGHAEEVSTFEHASAEPYYLQDVLGANNAQPLNGVQNSDDPHSLVMDEFSKDLEVPNCDAEAHSNYGYAHDASTAGEYADLFAPQQAVPEEEITQESIAVVAPATAPKSVSFSLSSSTFGQASSAPAFPAHIDRPEEIASLDDALSQAPYAHDVIGTNGAATSNDSHVHDTGHATDVPYNSTDDVTVVEPEVDAIHERLQDPIAAVGTPTKSVSFSLSATTFGQANAAPVPFAHAGPAEEIRDVAFHSHDLHNATADSVGLSPVERVEPIVHAEPVTHAESIGVPAPVKTDDTLLQHFHVKAGGTPVPATHGRNAANPESKPVTDFADVLLRVLGLKK